MIHRVTPLLFCTEIASRSVITDIGILTLTKADYVPPPNVSVCVCVGGGGLWHKWFQCVPQMTASASQFVYTMFPESMGGILPTCMDTSFGQAKELITFW